MFAIGFGTTTRRLEPARLDRRPDVAVGIVANTAPIEERNAWHGQEKFGKTSQSVGGTDDVKDEVVGRSTKNFRAVKVACIAFTRRPLNVRSVCRSMDQVSVN